MTMKLRIPQATKRGYVEVATYGAFDWNYPSSLTRRGRVQWNCGDVSPTICCQNEIYVYEPDTTEPRTRRNEQDDKG